MTTIEEAARFRDLYLAAFQANTKAPSEDALHVAYELGREAVAGELGLLELTHIHHEVLASRLEGCEPQDIGAVMETANEFFLQTLSAYEMIQRGFVETQEELRSEREHAHQLRRLADSSLVINSSLSIEDMLAAVTEHSRGIVGAVCCVAGMTAAHADIAKTAISHKGDPSVWDRLISDAVVSEIHDAASLLDEPVRFTRDDLPFRSLGEARAPVGEVLLAPLKRQGRRCVGFILLANRVGRRFTD